MAALALRDTDYCACTEILNELFSGCSGECGKLSFRMRQTYNAAGETVFLQ